MSCQSHSARSWNLCSASDLFEAEPKQSESRCQWSSTWLAGKRCIWSAREICGSKLQSSPSLTFKVGYSRGSLHLLSTSLISCQHARSGIQYTTLNNVFHKRFARGKHLAVTGKILNVLLRPEVGCDWPVSYYDLWFLVLWTNWNNPKPFFGFLVAGTGMQYTSPWSASQIWPSTRIWLQRLMNSLSSVLNVLVKDTGTAWMQLHLLFKQRDFTQSCIAPLASCNILSRKLGSQSLPSFHVLIMICHATERDERGTILLKRLYVLSILNGHLTSLICLADLTQYRLVWA